MIVDDIVNHSPSIAKVLTDAIVVRVPWKILPGECDQSAWDLAKANQDTGVYDWTQLRLPYPKLVLVSEFKEPGFLFVETIPGLEPSVSCSMHLTAFILTQSAIKIIGLYFAVKNDILAAAFLEENSQQDHDMFADYVTGYLNQLRACAELPPMSESARRAMSSPRGRRALELTSSSYGVTLSAIAALFACKNIEQQVVTPDQALQARRMKRGHLPLYRYTVLAVKPRMGTAHSLVLNDTASSTAIHWVRGHFKRYTDENKLFGRYTGLYWWQPHLAGTAPRVVQKDYQLVVGASR